MKRFSLCILLVGLLAACNKSEGEPDSPIPGDKPVWETYTHASLLKFFGAPKESREYFEEQGEQIERLTIRFDAAGHCTYYNGTGIDPETAAYGFGVDDVWYAYAYDSQGHMSSAIRYQMGREPVTYTITYGSHESYVVAPFPLGDIRPFMLKGVTRIEGTGYLLTSDGRSAESEETTTGWGASTVRTAWTITAGMPSEAQADIERGGEEIATTATTYSYKKNRLVQMQTVRTESDGWEQWESIEYSTLWPCSPIVRSVGEAENPTMRIEYKYAENGLPISAACTEGTPVDFGDVFRQWYNAYDAKGNWTSSTVQVEEAELILDRNVSYY